ncbi:MAG: hypothetical protein JOZ47_07675 [Kutzneria sp.]|nr:hypothetical protein [Kutzneria sp.]
MSIRRLSSLAAACGVAAVLAFSAQPIAGAATAGPMDNIGCKDYGSAVNNKTVTVVTVGHLRSCPSTGSNVIGTFEGQPHVYRQYTGGENVCPGNGVCSKVWYLTSHGWASAALTNRPNGV